MTFYRTIVVVWIVDFEVDKKDQNKEKKYDDLGENYKLTDCL